MINKNHADIQAALTGEKNGLISFPGWSIQDLSKLYTDDNSKNTGVKLSYDDFANVLGDTAVFKKYLDKKVDVLKSVGFSDRSYNDADN